MTDDNWQPQRIPPSFEQLAVRRIKRILNERSTPKPKKPTVESSSSENPEKLSPIHLRTDPLPQLSLEDQLFAIQRGARNIVRRREIDLANYKPSFRSQPYRARPRKKNNLIDDSAVESDGEGGDIESSPTTPANSRPSSPTPTSSVTTAQVNTQSIRKTIVKKPRANSHCTVCNIFVSGPKQLDIHYKSKKHKKTLGRSKSSSCRQCNRFFTSYHNLKNHKCANFL